MDNKNIEIINPIVFNTINISYRLNPRGKFIEGGQFLQAQAPTLNKQHPTTEEIFSDSKLKYGKCQTLKQSSFNRLRINIYRRDKKTKWQQLMTKNIHLQVKQMAGSQQYPKDMPNVHERDNKTSLNCRQIKDIPNNINKSKTHSSEKQDISLGQSLNETAIVKQSRLVREIIDEGKINRLAKRLLQTNRTDQSLNFKTPNELRMDELNIIRQKYRNLSNSIKPRVDPQKISIKKLKYSPKLHEKANNIIDMNDCKDGRDFDAWDNIDLFSSNKGIIEYAREVVEVPVQKNQLREEYQVYQPATHKRRHLLIRCKRRQ